MGAANWMEWAYFLPTEIALLLVGFVLLQTGYPKWLAWPVLVLGGVMLIVSFSVRRRGSALSLHFIPDRWNRPPADTFALASTAAFGDLE